MPRDSTKLDWVVLVNLVRFSRIGARACANACPISWAGIMYHRMNFMYVLQLFSLTTCEMFLLQHQPCSAAMWICGWFFS